ncbi:MAG: hypothetical protein FD155_3370 [Bacteroidetes bacterium]|nr:MAG: hypothetical protein FD155_3370 [Bacteroidota bacterium]
MEAIIITKEQFEHFQARIETIYEIVGKLTPPKNFLDNSEFIQLMNISKRTAQTWRDDKIIAFSQIGSKIYYRYSDIEKLLKSNYFNNK